MQSGIAISFRKMKKIKINNDGISAQFDAGLTNGDVLRSLWKIGKHAGKSANVTILIQPPKLAIQ